MWHPAQRGTQLRLFLPMTRWLPGAGSGGRGCPSRAGGLRPEADHTGLGGGSSRASRLQEGREHMCACVPRASCVSLEGLGGPGTQRPLGAGLLSSLRETEPPPPRGHPRTGRDVNPGQGSREAVTCPLGLQFSSVAQPCPTLSDPMDSSEPGLPVHHQLPEFTGPQTLWAEPGEAAVPRPGCGSPF